MRWAPAVRVALAGWIAGCVEGVGIGISPHANPYVSLGLVFVGMLLTGVVFAAIFGWFLDA